MAKAAIETACWDLEAKDAACPCGNISAAYSAEIACGVSIGIQDTPEACSRKIEKELAAGYQRIKIKIKPGWDLKMVEQVRERVSRHSLDG